MSQLFKNLIIVKSVFPCDIGHRGDFKLKLRDMFVRDAKARRGERKRK